MTISRVDYLWTLIIMSPMLLTTTSPSGQQTSHRFRQKRRSLISASAFVHIIFLMLLSTAGVPYFYWGWVATLRCDERGGVQWSFAYGFPFPFFFFCYHFITAFPLSSSYMIVDCMRCISFILLPPISLQGDRTFVCFFAVFHVGFTRHVSGRDGDGGVVHFSRLLICFFYVRLNRVIDLRGP